MLVKEDLYFSFCSIFLQVNGLGAIKGQGLTLLDAVLSSCCAVNEGWSCGGTGGRGSHYGKEKNTGVYAASINKI